MHLPENLLTLFSAEIEERDGTPVVTLPEREVEAGTLAVGDTYRVAIVSDAGTGEATTGEQTGEATTREQRSEENTREQTSEASPREDTSESWRTPGRSSPPVAEGDRREVEIEDVGDQGDGIARVGPGYIVFVPGSGVGERLTVEITRAEENFAFADVVEDEPAGG